MLWLAVKRILQWMCRRVFGVFLLLLPGRSAISSRWNLPCAHRGHVMLIEGMSFVSEVGTRAPNCRGETIVHVDEPWEIACGLKFFSCMLRSSRCRVWKPVASSCQVGKGRNAGNVYFSRTMENRDFVFAMIIQIKPKPPKIYSVVSCWDSSCIMVLSFPQL